MVLQADEQVEGIIKALKRNRFDAKLAGNTEEARRIILKVIPADAVVGIGDSVTVRQTGVLPELKKRGTEIIDPFLPEISSNWDLMVETMRRTFQSSVFLTGSNAVTLDGKLMSTDMVGNRVAGMIFGAPTVVLVIGKNKIVKDLDEAQKRLKEVIAPYHAAAKGRKVPCVKTGICSDCHGPERICNVSVFLEAKPLLTDIIIILVNEDLGLSWDPRWPEERINSIKWRYRKVTWSIPVPDEALGSG